MAEESYQEHELGNVYHADNVHGAENAHNMENIHGIDKAHENLPLEEEKFEPEEVQAAFHQGHSVILGPGESQVESPGGHAVKSEPGQVQVTENGSGGSEEKRWHGWPGENVFRMLVPSQKVGGIIGRKGEYIKKTCEEIKARIKVLDGPPGTTERAVMISAKEEPRLSIPPAMDGLLKVHKRIIDVDHDPTNAPSGAGRRASTRLLVAATQAAILIGKQGATVKSIQDESHCSIRVLGGEHLPVFALRDDSIVEIQGEPAGVHKAVEMIATHLRKFLVDRSVIGVFEKLMQMPNAHSHQNMPLPGPTQPWCPPPSSFPISAGVAGFGVSHQYMPPPRQFDNYLPRADMPLDKQPHQAAPVYGRDPSVGAHGNAQPQQSIVSKVTQNIQIPLSYADAVIGASGSNISYIRRTCQADTTLGTPSSHF
ncbi:unnamed protein product [Withania somnifera]